MAAVLLFSFVITSVQRAKKSLRRQWNLLYSTYILGKDVLLWSVPISLLSVNNAIFRTEMTTVLEQTMSFCENAICLGDLNCDILNLLMNNHQGKCLLDICDIFDLDTLIKQPTRISTTRASCLDVILSNVPMFMKTSAAVETGISDHLLVYTVLNTRMLHAKATVTKTRTFKNLNRDSFQEDLSRVLFHAAYVFDDLDDVYWCWETLYNQVLDDHAPMRSFKRRRSVESNFITPEIRREMAEPNRLKKDHETRGIGRAIALHEIKLLA